MVTSFIPEDGGAATNATLNAPSGVAVDTYGNLFIADANNNRIRRVDTNGIISTVAGNGSVTYSGDGATATNAGLSASAVAVDAFGNLFIADDYNSRIRKVDANGLITTVAGNGSSSYSGDGGAATNAGFSASSVAIDAVGNLFIADAYNNIIRRVDTNGFITTVAGNGNSGYSGDEGPAIDAALSDPNGVAVDAKGNISIADVNNNRIREVTNSTYSPYLPLLMVNNVSITNVGNYSVIITSSSGSITSSVAGLTLIPASISQQPQNQAAALGSAILFNVVASSAAPLTYQWYFSNPALQTTAEAVAQTLYGFCYGTIVTNGGSGYTTVPQVQFIGGGGNGAGGSVTISNGQVATITMTNAGSDYVSSPTVLIDPPSGLLIGETNAILNLSTITTNNLGSYYVIISNIYGSLTSSVANLTSASPSLTQQPQNQTVLFGTGADFDVTAAGLPPFSYQWWTVAGQQSNATAVPLVINGFVLTATITSGGAGYLAVPAVQFVGGSGSGAIGTAVVSNQIVTAINMSSAGSGYTTPPAVQIDAPTAISLAGQTNSGLFLAGVTDANAGNYFVVVTNNYGSTTSHLATLTIKGVAPQSLALTATGIGLQLQFIGTPNHPYILETTTNLASLIDWQPA